MAVCNRKRDVTNLQIELITNVLKLEKLNVLAVLAVFYVENDVKTFGTMHMKDLFSQFEQKVELTAIKKDILNVTSSNPVDPNAEINLPKKVKAKQIFQQFFSQKEPDKLPLPLSCMNRKEKIVWLTKRILDEQREMPGKMLNNVKYGDPNLVPSFWLNEDWNWLKRIYQILKLIVILVQVIFKTSFLG